MDGKEASSSQSQHTAAVPAATSVIVRDVFLWRRKMLSFTLLMASTAIWVLLEVYQFKFVTVASWVAMFIVSFTFLFRNIMRIIGKEPPNLSALEISERSALEIANSFRVVTEECIRWMFHASVEREWFVFAQVVAGLLLLSYVGTLADLLTLLCTNTVLGMTVPVIYQKYGDKIKSWGEAAKVKSRRFNEKVDEKVFKKLKNKVLTKEENKEKEKKVE